MVAVASAVDACGVTAQLRPLALEILKQLVHIGAYSETNTTWSCPASVDKPTVQWLLKNRLLTVGVNGGGNEYQLTIGCVCCMHIG